MAILRASLDFVPASRWPGLGWVMLAVGLCALMFFAREAWNASEQLTELRSQVSSLEPKRSSARPSSLPKSDRLSSEYAKSIQKALLKPWDRLFRAIESAYRPEVALLSIEPDARHGTVVIGGEASEFSQVAEFLRRLEAGSLTRVYVVSHQQTGQKVVFKLSAQWDEAAAEASR